METFVDTALHNALLAVPLAVLALAVGLVVRRPALIHVLWLLVLLRFVMPPLWRVEVPRPFASIESATAGVAPEFVVAEPQPTDTAETPRLDTPGPELRMEPQDGPTVVVEAGAMAAAPFLPPQTIQPDPSESNAVLGVIRTISWRQALGTAWLASALGLLAVSLWRVMRFSMAVRAARPAPPDVQRLAKEIAGRIGVRQIPQIVLVRGNLSPMLWCCFAAPKIILPEALWRRLEPVRQSTLLAHELAHFRRGDHWIRALELIAGALFWWHPVVWIARRQLREAEERCCDAWVVWALARRDYATALVDAVGFLSEDRSVLPAFASGVGQVRHLRGRLTMIMRGDTPRRLPRLALAGVMAGGLALATLSAGFAQERRDDRPGDRRPAPERRRDDERRAEERQPPRDELDPKIREELEKARRNFEEARQRLEELERRFGRGRERERERSRDRAPEGRPVPPLPPGPPRAPAGIGFAPRGDQPIERRMDELERRMEMMVRQLEEMRRMLRRGPDRERGGPGESERGGNVRERDPIQGEPGANVPKIRK